MIPKKSNLFSIFMLSILLQGCGSDTTKDQSISLALNIDNPTPIIEEEFTLTWLSRNALHCSAEGSWSGEKALSGSEKFNFADIGNQEFVLLCRNDDYLIKKSVVVDIELPPPFSRRFPEGRGTDLIISYGQSNAVGRATILNEDYGLELKTKMYKKCLDQYGYSLPNEDCGSFADTNHPTDIYGYGGHSAWPVFIEKLEEYSWRNLVFINSAVGDTNLKELMKGNSVPKYSTNKRYESLIWAIRDAITLIERDQINSLSLIWLQGENDIYDITKQGLALSDVNDRFTEYFSDLEVLRKDILEDSGADDGDFFIIRLGNVFSPASDEVNHNLLNDLGYWQIDFSCQKLGFKPLSILPRKLEATEMLGDGIHYNRSSNIKLGENLQINFMYIQQGNNFESICQENSAYPPTIIAQQPF